MTDQDWQEVVIRKKAPKPKNSEDALRKAATGEISIETHKKYNAAKNTQNNAPVNAKKLEADLNVEEEAPPMTVQTVSHSMALKIQQARSAKGWNRKELAQRINQKESVIADYETGKAIPNNAIINQLERALGVKLRGK